MRLKSSDKKKVEKEDRRLLKKRVKNKVRSMTAKSPEFNRSPDGSIERKESRTFWKNIKIIAQNPAPKEVIMSSLMRDFRSDARRRFLKVRILGRSRLVQSLIELANRAKVLLQILLSFFFSQFPEKGIKLPIGNLSLFSKFFHGSQRYPLSRIKNSNSFAQEIWQGSGSASKYCTTPGLCPKRGNIRFYRKCKIARGEWDVPLIPEREKKGRKYLSWTSGS